MTINISTSVQRGVLRVAVGAGLGMAAIACSQPVSGSHEVDTDTEMVPEWGETELALEAKPGPAPGRYYEIRPDMRKCVSPLCGGYFVKALNRPRTRCADGTFESECYVAEVKANQPLPVAASVVVHGSIESNVYPDFGELGRLVVDDAWGSATDVEPRGVFFRVSNSGIVCITTPCPTIELQRLNTPFGRRVSGLNLKAAGASDEQLTAAQAAYEAGELIVSGRVKPGPPDVGPSLVGTQFYLPEPATQCSTDADCAKDEWCRQAEDGGAECVPFVGIGDSCGGFTLPWYFEQCLPGLVCDFPNYIADAPGVCRATCNGSEECPEEEYCTASGVCRGDGTCQYATDCNADGNTWPHIECVGHATCPMFGDGEQCGWQCGAPECIDLVGVDFGPCDAVLGYGVMFGQCGTISGCDAQGQALFGSLEDCQASCEL